MGKAGLASRYALAILAALVALSLRHLLIPLLGFDNPYHTAWLAVAFSAWYCGVGPSVVTALVGALGVWYWFLPPFHSFALQDRTEVFGIVGFLAFSGVIIALGESSRRGFEARFRMAAVVNSSDDAIITKNLDGVITSWNKAAERVFGYAAEEAVGQNITLIIPYDRRYEETEILARLRRGERIDHFDTVRVRKDGTPLEVSLTISPVRDVAGQIIGASKIARDISARKRVERELRESEQRFRTLADALDTQVQIRTQELQRRNAEILRQSDQLRELSGRLMSIQDEERRRIARDLHDSAGQNLAVLAMTLARIEDEAKHDPAQLSQTVEEARDLIEGLSQEIRTTSYLLHPPMLDEFGLSSALGMYLEGLEKRSGLSIELSIPADFGRLAPEVELAIFRLVQECLTNIHRHSGSKTAVIRINRAPDKIYAKVQDHGRGMSPERFAEVQSHGAGVGVGIRGMRERVRQAHGELTVDSNALGTTITAIFPAKKPAAQEQGRISRHSVA